MEVVSKPLMRVVDPFTLTFFRFLVGFFVLFLILYFKGQLKDLLNLNRWKVGSLFFLGFINAFFSMSMLQMAVKNGSAATAAVVFCSNPLFVFLFSIILREESFTVKRFAGFLLGISGIAFVMSEKGLTFNSGAVYALAASMAFAGYTVLGKKTLRSTPPLTVNVVSFFFGIVANAVFLILSGRGFDGGRELVESKEVFFSFLYLAVVVSALGYITFINTIKKYSAVSASIIFLLKPAVATFFALIFLGESLHLSFYTGLFLVIAGSGLIVSVSLKRTVRL
jgi:drug/metabolite transporter (DMT)-like permease